MKYLLRSLLVIASIALSGFLANDEKPKARLNVWINDGAPNSADSSAWTNRNQFQINFYSLSSQRKPGKKLIVLIFPKWPVVSGSYKLVSHPRKDDEMAVIAYDEFNTYFTRTGSGDAHVSVNNGKLSAWANNIALDIKPDRNRTTRTPFDTAVFSFNLSAL